MIEQRIKALIPEGLPTVIGDLPSTRTSVVGIMLFDGAANEEYFNFQTVYSPVVKLVVRHDSYATGQQWLEAIKGALHRYHDEYFLSITLRGYPVYLGRDEQKLHTFQIVFNILTKE